MRLKRIKIIVDLFWGEIMKNIFFFFLAVIFLFAININAQENDNNDIEIFNDNEFWDEDVNFFTDLPIIEVLYGIEIPSIHKDAFSSSFNKPSSLEGRFGYLDIDKDLYKSSMFSINGNYLFIGYLTNDLSFNKNDIDNKKFSVDVWNIGVSEFDSYGWEFSENFNLQFYTSGSLLWSGVSCNDSLLNQADYNKISRITDGVRFGDRYETGFKFQFYKPLSIVAGFQRHLIYSRVLFWKWTGSKIVQGIGEAIVNMFNDDIMKSSPNFGPIIYFILNTAYNYGWYELCKSNMNFPFSTEEPLIIDSFKFGFNIVF